MLSPSVLSADFGHLERDIEMLNASSADFIHLDVMDGVFVPNISFGFPVMESIARVAKKPLDVHLMIVQPEKFVSRVRDLGAAIMNVHQEACPHLNRVLRQIREAGMKSAVTLNPATPLASIEDVLGEADMVLLMSVNPGFGGQTFIQQTYSRLKRLRKMIDEGGYSMLIEIDGGVNRNNAPLLYEAGADVLVAGNAVFKAADPLAEIALLQKKQA